METQVNERAPETKAGVTGDALVTQDQLSHALETLKAESEARIASERSGADPVFEEKLAEIRATLRTQQRQIDQSNLKAARPALETKTNGPARTLADMEHKSAFNTYVRRGDSASLAALETKAMSVGSNPDGGYLVPPEVETEIGRRLAAISPIRSVAMVQQVSSSTYRKPFMVTGPAVGWVGETAPRPQTASPVLDALTFNAMELYAMPAATATLLDDAAVNIDEWLAREVEQAFAQQEGAAFVSGDGVNKPMGFLSYPTVPNGTWTWGNLGYLATGAAGAFPSSNPSDVLVDLVYSVRAAYRQNAVFVMNRRTQSTIRKFKDTSGTFLWQPPAGLNARATLMGFPVVESEDMPDIGAGAPAIAFGDFGRGYLIVDRQGVRVLRDPYSAKPYVLFYTTKRVGGGVQDFDAIKLLKFAAS